MDSHTKEVSFLDAKGYYAEQFLCRHYAPIESADKYMEEILDHIFLAVNIVEEVAPHSLDSPILDLSTDVSGIVTQLMLRGFKNVTSVPESSEALDKRSREFKSENWKVAMDLGLQADFPEVDAGKLKAGIDVVLFMDSSFNQYGLGKQNTVIKKCAEILNTDGTIVLDLSNPIERFRNILWDRRWSEDRSCYFLSEETIDPYTLEYRTEIISISKSDGTINRTRQTGYLVHLPTIKDILNENGLTITKVFGNYEQDSLAASSTRMIIIARKKK